MPDLIRHPGQLWIPAFAGMTALTYIVAGVISLSLIDIKRCNILYLSDFTIFYRGDSRPTVDGFQLPLTPTTPQILLGEKLAITA